MSGFNLILLTLSLLTSYAFVVPGSEGVACKGGNHYATVGSNNGQHVDSQYCGETKKVSKSDVGSNQVALHYRAPLETVIHSVENRQDLVEKKPLILERKSITEKKMNYIITKKYFKKKSDGQKQYIGKKDSAPKPVIEKVSAPKPVIKTKVSTPKPVIKKKVSAPNPVAKEKDNAPKPVITQPSPTLQPNPKKIETKAKVVDPSGLEQKFSGCFYYTSQNPQLKSKPLTEQVLEVTNCYRRAEGVPPLTNSAQLAEQANSYSQKLTKEVLKDKNTAHSKDGTIMNRCNKAKFKRKCAENLSGVSTDPDQVVMSWMKSPPHRKNLLDKDLTDLGVGFQNEVYTQLFAKKG